MAKNSAYTSTRQIPAAFKIKEAAAIFGDGSNLDYGGGKYDDASHYLLDSLSCDNAVYDPYNRPPAHNIWAVRTLNGLLDHDSDWPTAKGALEKVYALIAAWDVE